MWHWLVYVGMHVEEVSLSELPLYIESCTKSNQYLTDKINGVGTYDGEIIRVELCLTDSLSYRVFQENMKRKDVI